jgi:hypothetical protein
MKHSDKLCINLIFKYNRLLILLLSLVNTFPSFNVSFPLIFSHYLSNLGPPPPPTILGGPGRAGRGGGVQRAVQAGPLGWHLVPYT